MGFQSSLLFLPFLAVLITAQQIGTYTPEVHPKITSERCTLFGGCVPANTSVVLDSNYRWTHVVGGYDNCVAGGLDAAYCPTVEACGTNCALEGVDYATYGIATSGNSVTLNLFVDNNNVTSLSSPRAYLFDESKGEYSSFKLLNQEISFDVDVSKVPCGINGALYLTEMSLTGDASDLNTAGAAYGTGYCDAQCPNQNFVKGLANINGTLGACCNEMDLWEANNAATAFTPHPCNITGVYACTEPLCGDASRYEGVCDKDGCDYNSYRNGVQNFYGRGSHMSVDTTKPFTVVTQFLTKNNAKNGPLSEIRRLYVQHGVVIQNSRAKVDGLAPVNSITDAYCTAQKEVFDSPDAFATQGGMKGMGEALSRGMVLAFSIWDDSGTDMLWLDSNYPTDADPTAPGVARGPCATTSGNPADLITQYPDAAVTFSKIRSGDIGSTFGRGS